MSGSAACVMDPTSIPRLKLMLVVFLLVSPNIICLHGHSLTGVDHKLHCVNDYLSIVNCSLTIAPSENTSDSSSSYWLKIVEFVADDDSTEFVCMLTKTNGTYFCTVKIPPLDFDHFMDSDAYKISLCHNQSVEPNTCKLLDEEYEPSENIKPNPPCCLTVSQNSRQHHFFWNSTYENYSTTSLVNDLMYQLHYYKIQDKDGVPIEINTDSKNYSIDDDTFLPNTDYAARVRSSPNGAHYKGEWSKWSSEVHWTTKAPLIQFSTLAIVSGVGMKVFIPIFVMVPLILLLCYAPIKKWRQSAFIPTPAPYFQTLYSDCQGDFKSWVVTQENTADMLKAEETLHIYTLTKCADVQEEDTPPNFHEQLIEGSGYNNITSPGYDSSLLGVPYAVSTMAPLSSSGSLLNNLTSNFQPGSPAEGDSGCWLCSDTSLDQSPPWYCNEYCTLSTFQQSSPVTAERHGSLSTRSCSAEIIRVDTFGQA